MKEFRCGGVYYTETMMSMTDTKDRICEILRATERPGIEAVINYLLTSNYFRRGCYGHHKEYGGLALHSLEVYEHMLSHTSGYAANSIAVVGLLHDLGKTTRSDGRGHDRRSVEILDRLGFALTDEERTAIGRHHDKSLGFLTCPIRRNLTAADCSSTRNWKHAHPELCHHRRHHHHNPTR